MVVCEAAKLADYFPTKAEPDFVPREPPFCPDDELLVKELRLCGCAVEPIVWGTPIAALTGFDMVLFRSPWDYMDSVAMRMRFVSWLEELQTSGLYVENAADTMLWLIDKHYLHDFERCGVAIVPTCFVECDGDVPDLDALCARWECNALIVKPAISAAGVGLEFARDAAAIAALQPRLAQLCVGGAQLIQPFVSQIQTEGEWSLVYLGGVFSHALRKRPAAGGILCHAEQGGSLEFLATPPPADVLALGDAVLAAVPAAQSLGRLRAGASVATPVTAPLYLRVDVLIGGKGPLLSECEGVEPELFFRAKAGAAARAAELILARVDARPH
jgi:hypothetical protein